MKSIDYIFIIGLGLLLLLAPWLFTRPAFCECLNFSNTGGIGDTIGGVTAPIVGLISIILLWLTLREQFIFNKTQARDNMINHIITLENNIVQIKSSISQGITELSDNNNGAYQKFIEILQSIHTIILLAEQMLIICKEREFADPYKATFIIFSAKHVNEVEQGLTSLTCLTSFYKNTELETLNYNLKVLNDKVNSIRVLNARGIKKQIIVNA